MSDNSNIYVDRALTNKKVIENSAVNTLYLTNQCNLACTYCYEDLANKEKEKLSYEQLKKNIDLVFERENDDAQTLFILFGGEPTLVWDKCKYAVEYALSKKENCHFNMITNGIKFLDNEFAKEFKNYKYNKYISLDVSFDGSGNSERIYHSGKKSSDDMIKVFEQFRKYKMKWRLRYTINKENVDNIVEDLIELYVKYKPERLITSVAWTTLKNSDTKKISIAKEKLRLLWQNNMISSPVCDMFCDICDGCSNTLDYKAYYNEDGEVRIDKNNKSVGKFNDFKEKRK
jgi:sulfatase maturation enzyme AslB (radical SAM superfamily)